jgi:hypothetical protein
LRKLYDRIMKYILLFALVFGVSQNINSQHHEPVQSVHENSDENTGHNEVQHTHNKHIVAFYAAFTHIPGAFYESETNERRSGKFVPTLGLDYYYHFAPKWATGIMADFEFDDYYVNRGEEELIRDNIWVAALVTKYKAHKYIDFFAGPGYEMERKKGNTDQESISFWLIRAGVEFAVPIENNWYMGTSFLYDFKEEYHSFSFDRKPIIVDCGLHIFYDACGVNLWCQLL